LKKLIAGIEKVLPDDMLLEYIGGLQGAINKKMINLVTLPKNKDIKDMAIVIERLVKLKILILENNNKKV